MFDLHSFPVESEKEIKLEISKSEDMIFDQNIKLIMRRPDNAVLGIYAKMDIKILDETDPSCVMGKVDNSLGGDEGMKTGHVWNQPPAPPKRISIDESPLPPSPPLVPSLPESGVTYDPVNKDQARSLVRSLLSLNTLLTSQHSSFHAISSLFNQQMTSSSLTNCFSTTVCLS